VAEHLDRQPRGDQVPVPGAGVAADVDLMPGAVAFFPDAGAVEVAGDEPDARAGVP
jgi:hypothetical protein